MRKWRRALFLSKAGVEAPIRRCELGTTCGVCSNIGFLFFIVQMAAVVAFSADNLILAHLI